MKRRLLQFLTALSRAVGIFTLYSGLVLAAARHFFWGLLFFAVGLTIIGLQEEG